MDYFHDTSFEAGSREYGDKREGSGGMYYVAVLMGLHRFDQRVKQDLTKPELNGIYKRNIRMLYV